VSALPSTPSGAGPRSAIHQQPSVLPSWSQPGTALLPSQHRAVPARQEPCARNAAAPLPRSQVSSVQEEPTPSSQQKSTRQKLPGNNTRERYQQRITVSASQLVSSYAAAVNTNQPFKLASNCPVIQRHRNLQADLRRRASRRESAVKMPSQDARTGALRVSQPATSSNAASPSHPRRVQRKGAPGCLTLRGTTLSCSSFWTGSKIKPTTSGSTPVVHSLCAHGGS